MKKIVILSGFLFASAVSRAAFEDTVLEENLRTEYANITLTRRVSGLNRPWAVAFPGENQYLITERGGRLLFIDENGERHVVSGLPDDLISIRQGGLLDLVLHPNFDENGWIYITYSRGTRQETATTLIRARLDGTQLVDVEQLFTQERKSQPGRHYGSRILFTDKNTLLMTIGDRGPEEIRAQDPLDHAGTVLRLRDDGTVPEDNPFVGNPRYLPEIFSYGHRNIQSLALHPETGEIWAVDHGARGGDRLDRIDAGLNYGWPVATPSLQYRDASRVSDVRPGFGKVPPVFEIIPTLAPSGLAFADPDTFPGWEGSMLAGGLASQKLMRLVPAEGPIYKFNAGQRRITIEGPYLLHAENMLISKIGRIRDVRTAPNGFIYLLTDETDGGLYRIQPAD
jgi:glucose/arabinose dehydrogenase